MRECWTIDCEGIKRLKSRLMKPRWTSEEVAKGKDRGLYNVIPICVKSSVKRHLALEVWKRFYCHKVSQPMPFCNVKTCFIGSTRHSLRHHAQRSGRPPLFQKKFRLHVYTLHHLCSKGHTGSVKHRNILSSPHHSESKSSGEPRGKRSGSNFYYLHK